MRSSNFLFPGKRVAEAAVVGPASSILVPVHTTTHTQHNTIKFQYKYSIFDRFSKSNQTHFFFSLFFGNPKRKERETGHL